MKYILFIAFSLGISSYTTEEKKVWDFCIDQMKLTEQGAASIMGVLKEISNFRSVYYDNAYKSTIGLSAQEYVDKVNDGSYMKVISLMMVLALV